MDASIDIIMENLVASEEKHAGMNNSSEVNDERSVGYATSTYVRDPTFCENLTRRDLKHFRKFVDTTSTHGVRRIFVGTSKIRRYFWLLLFLVALMISFINCCDQIGFLLEWQTSLSVYETRQPSLPFPAVTVCNINPARRSITHQLDIADYLQCIFRAYTYTGSMLLNTADNIRSCKKKHTYNTEILNRTIFEVFKNASQDPSRFIVDCSWYGTHNIQSSCSYKNFTGVPTNAGYCYTFNGGENPLNASGPGRRFGFDITLNIEQEEYLLGTQTAGVFVTIHHQSEPPQPLQSGLAVPPGLHAFISLNYETRELVLPQNHGTCQTEWNENTEKKEFNWTTYNVPTCVQNNLFTRVAKRCGCIDPIAPAPIDTFSDYSSCTMDDFPCVMQESINTTSSGEDDNKCNVSCSKVLFPSHLSFGSFPTKALEAKSSHTSDIRRNYLHVSIYYENLFQNILKQKIVYNWQQLIANIGGQLSLFLGLSVISFTEFIVWVLDEIKDRLLCFKVVRDKLRRTSKRGSYDNLE